MKEFEEKNLLDALEQLGKLELLLKVNYVESRNLDEITEILWNTWKMNIKNKRA